MWIRAGGDRGQPGQLLEEVQYHPAREDFHFTQRRARQVSLTEAAGALPTPQKSRWFAGRLDDVAGSKAVARLRWAGKTTAFQKPLPFTSQIGDVTFFGFGSIRVCRARRSVERKR